MGLFQNILNRFRGGGDIDWDDLEETLVTSDLGIRLTTELVERVRKRKGKKDAESVVEAMREEIRDILGATPPLPAPGTDGKPLVILIAGVNGVGKTTSVAKLAHYLKNHGNSVMLAAADTFRAAAIEQLTVWAERLDVPLVKTQYQGDPSAVCYDAHASAIAAGTGYLLCDTAGRLHTRHNLMEELKKVRRTIAKQDERAPQERWIVVDATTGSNALAQAKEFHAALDLTGVIVTKLDGSGKGGSVVAIAHELGIPTRFIGTGEKFDDFEVFDTEKFVNTIL